MIRLRGTGRLCAGRHFRRPCVAAAPGSAIWAKPSPALEKCLRARLPKTPQGELLGGAHRGAFCLPVGTFLLTSLVCMGAAALHPLLGLAVQMFWCGQALAAKGLCRRV